MIVSADRKAFAAGHQPHGPLTGDAGRADDERIPSRDDVALWRYIRAQDQALTMHVRGGVREIGFLRLLNAIKPWLAFR